MSDPELGGERRLVLGGVECLEKTGSTVPDMRGGGGGGGREGEHF